MINLLFAPTDQLSEGLEHRIGIMETSLSRFAMILDSVQSDVMQVNKGTKEFILESKWLMTIFWKDFMEFVFIPMNVST